MPPPKQKAYPGRRWNLIPARPGDDGKKKTSERVEKICAALMHGASVAGACAHAGIGYGTYYRWHKNDEEFAALTDMAREVGTDLLEDEAFRRAYEGVLRPVYQGGVAVGEVTEYSDTLMVTLLKARRPSKYKDRVANEFTGKDGGPIQVETADAARAAILEQLTSIASRIGTKAGSKQPQ